MPPLTKEEKERIARLQFDPLSPKWAATYERYLVKGPNVGAETINDFTTNQYEKLVHDNPDIDIGIHDLKSIVEKFDMNEFGRRLGDPLRGLYDSITEKVLDSYMHCVCAYKNKPVRPIADSGTTRDKDEESQKPDTEIGGKKAGEAVQRKNKGPQTPGEGKKGAARTRSRSPERNQETTDQKSPGSYRSRTPINDKRRSLRHKPDEGLSSRRSRNLERSHRNEGQIVTPEDTPGKSTKGKSTKQQLGESQGAIYSVKYRSCVTLCCEDWIKICHGTGILSMPQPGAFYRKLEDIDCLGDKLRNLDYLFLPINSEGTHYFLSGIAPKQKFVFAIDSYARNQRGHTLDDDDVDPITEILLQEFPGEAFPMYGQWALRSKTTDNSPNCAQQSDMYNCGLFTITNALCLAFGYDLLCYTQKDIDEGKRQRVAAELLHGGFLAPFNYPLLEIPLAQVASVNDEPGERSALEGLRQEDTEMRDGDIEAERPRNITPTLDRGEWPAQFNPSFFQKAGLTYAITEPMFQDLKYKYQLETACRKHKIKRYTRWKKKPISIFRGWMENVMAGRKAESSGGLQPFSSQKKTKYLGQKTSVWWSKPRKSATMKLGSKATFKEMKAQKQEARKFARRKSGRKH